MILGVAISTRDRRDLFTETVTHWRKHLPRGAFLVIIDDASDQPLIQDGHRELDNPGVKVVRHEYPRGVAVTKNRCLAELMDAGCDHIWLSDDDVWPIADDWWQPYLASPEPHLCLNWPHHHSFNIDGTGWPPRVTHEDSQHRYYTFPRGVLLYLERRVVDVVGGMNPAHGMFSGEHVEHSGRVHAAGLTTAPFGDIRDSDKLFHSQDRQSGNITGSSTFSLKERRLLHKANGVHYDRRDWPGWPYMPYREGDGFQDWSLGPDLTGSPLVTGDPGLACLQHVLAQRPPGVGIEFGVGSGRTLRMIADVMPAIGFGSRDGLPEDWRPEFPKGSFAAEPPDIPNATVVEGLFAETLPTFDFGKLGHIGLVNLDADLYSSTATALDHIGPHLKPGCFIHLDEAFGHDGAEHHEMRAFCEWADETGVTWSVVGHGIEQWLLRLT